MAGPGDPGAAAAAGTIRAALDRHLAERDAASLAGLQEAVGRYAWVAGGVAVELHQQGDTGRAEPLYKAVLSHGRPEHAGAALNNLILLACQSTDFDTAWQWVRQAVLQDPQSGAELAYRVGRQALLMGRQDILARAIAVLRSLRPAELRTWSAGHVEACFRDMHEGGAPPPPPATLAAARPRTAPLRRDGPRRVVLVGEDFAPGTSYHRLLGPFAELAGQELEVICLCTAPQTPRERSGLPGLPAICVPEAGAAAFEASLRGLAPDVAIDLIGHGRPELFAAYAARPAPLQLGWAGNGLSSGIPAFDGFLTDLWHCPLGAERHYSEPVVRLPGRSVTVTPYADYPDATALPADRNGHITFGAFHRLSKLTPEVLALWAEVLAAVPGARLVMKTQFLDLAPVQERIRASFAAGGIGPERLTFMEMTAREHHCQVVAQTDIALTPFPEQGLVTDFDSFWMGIPAVALEVDARPCARLSAALSAAVGAPFLVTGNRQDYVAMAASLAADLPYLRAARRCYRRNLVAAGLTDHARTAAAMAAAIRELWRN